MPTGLIVLPTGGVPVAYRNTFPSVGAPELMPVTERFVKLLSISAQPLLGEAPPKPENAVPGELVGHATTEARAVDANNSHSTTPAIAELLNIDETHPKIEPHTCSKVACQIVPVEIGDGQTPKKTAWLPPNALEGIQQRSYNTLP